MKRKHGKRGSAAAAAERGYGKRLAVVAALAVAVALFTGYLLILPGITLEEENPAAVSLAAAAGQNSAAPEEPGTDARGDAEPPPSPEDTADGEETPALGDEENGGAPAGEDPPAADGAEEDALPADGEAEEGGPEGGEETPEPAQEPEEPQQPEETPAGEETPPEAMENAVPEEEEPQNPDEIAEPADWAAWEALADSGYFTYWQEQMGRQNANAAPLALRRAVRSGEGNDRQITARGGAEENAADGVAVSKTIAPTDLENVFDITLTVDTASQLSTLFRDPDMAVVIVMDVSNTMTYQFGDTTRYEAAMEAAENFLDRFAAETGDASRVGYVAFNTDAHRIFDLRACRNNAEAIALKNEMRVQTGQIISNAGSGERFTNVEAGLKMAQDMLAGASNRNRFIIFLSDGFPTTYVSGGYQGYNPYCSAGTPGNDGVFYDSVKGAYCNYGTSYSDKAAIRARQQAERIKNSGVQIFSIGVDVGGQTVQRYVDQTAGQNFSVVDRTGTNYEIGSPDSAAAYKNWLRNGIGSGVYYDSTDRSGLVGAYNDIFRKIQETIAADVRASWVTEDPIPALQGAAAYVEFIGFYDGQGYLTTADLTGAAEESGENTASFDTERYAIRWDLKQSGYEETQEGHATKYHYTLTYRVRLRNEAGSFETGKIYDTNDTTTLTYRVSKTEGGQTTVSEDRKLNFPIPAVQGYLGELCLQKQDQHGNAVPGAEFTLRHDTQNCAVCRGDGTAVEPVGPYIARSDGQGAVSFAAIPSGHQYLLEETGVPAGYTQANGDTYQVRVAYGRTTLTVCHPSGEAEDWTGEQPMTIVNRAEPVLPETGGRGTALFRIAGSIFCAAAAWMLLRRRYGRGRTA